MTGIESKAVGKLLAKGTSVEGFSTTDIRVLSTTWELKIEGVQGNGERLIFNVIAARYEFTEGRSFNIIDSEGIPNSVWARYHSPSDVYRGVSGKFVFVKFDGQSERATIDVVAVMRNSFGDEKEIQAQGEFVGFL
jgi:hypothetical protein